MPGRQYRIFPVLALFLIRLQNHLCTRFRAFQADTVPGMLTRVFPLTRNIIDYRNGVRVDFEPLSTTLSRNFMAPGG